MANAGDDWTTEEIEICVSAYANAVKAGATKRSIPKDIYLFRAVKKLPGRNEGAVSRRMGNISHVLMTNGGDPVIGWKALKNVGPTNTLRIQDELVKNGLI